jgi:xanthine dehydrogenase accessory factor
MYGIALTVAACLRAGTRADVAWLVEAEGLPIDDWSDAVVFTPGGGKIGSVAAGALDAQLADQAGRWEKGRLLDVEVTEIDALIAGLPSGGSARCLLVPADQFPAETWDQAQAREPFCLVSRMDGDLLASIDLHTTDTIAGAAEIIQKAWAGPVGSTMVDGVIVSVFRAVPQLVIVGATPIGDALARLAEVVGWRAEVAADAATATGLIAGLSEHDKVVVAAHDLELAGTTLMAALDGKAGYIGAVGSRKMQENRADWLAYRGVTDLSRIHGPAGLDIGADTPAEIAVSILAEAIAGGRQAVEPAPSNG